ncbi:hypothetical protein [Neptuniibacter pectenicola]|uniref:hypothetical protein n=1 Tax=Neptuniibacter pectenicola TaxID=1806669 RepID=UPI0007992855|nr:hypothetical protein [Neptuniibacter pectenicola]KXJ55171.1 MAG: hypothetical protein AXW15_07845 [Neptuniibacter sp. Phe_28]
MLHNTTYTLRQLGEDIQINIAYQHLESADINGSEYIQVIATSPLVNFSPEVMEEIELQCWTDIMAKKTNELLAEAAKGSPLTNPDQEITQCRTH